MKPWQINGWNRALQIPKAVLYLFPSLLVRYTSQYSIYVLFVTQIENVLLYFGENDESFPKSFYKNKQSFCGALGINLQILVV